jgi:hypothetical protein
MVVGFEFRVLTATFLLVLFIFLSREILVFFTLVFIAVTISIYFRELVDSTVGLGVRVVFVVFIVGQHLEAGELEGRRLDGRVIFLLRVFALDRGLFGIGLRHGKARESVT